MRYFSQLARETKARVMPARQPAWLPPIASLVQQSAAEWPALPAAGLDSESGQTPRAADLREPVPGNRQPVADNSTGMNPAPRLYPVKAEERNPEGSRERVIIEKHSNQELNPAIRSQSSGDAAPVRPSIAHPPSLDHHEPEISPVTAMPPQRTESIAPAVQQIRPVTLQDAISEIARRQEEFERRYRAQAGSTRIGPAPETAWAEPGSERESEGVSLNIGSIVVQVAPEPPAVKPAPAPVPRRAPGDSDHLWKRSFLDRY
jgi:hypothetical protein